MPFLRALSETGDTTIKLYYLNEIPESRKVLGWRTPEEGNVICRKVGEHEMLKSLVDREKRSVHIFGGYIRNGLFQAAIRRAYNNGSILGIMSEPPVVQQRGISKLMKVAYIKSMMVTGKDIKRKCSFLLKIGGEEDNSFEKMGWESGKIYNFGYFSEERPKVLIEDRNEKRVKIMYCGQFVEHKGVLTLLCAMKTLNRRGVNCICRLYGNGKLSDRVKKIAEEDELGGQVEIFEPMSNDKIREEMRKSDIYVAPGIVEPWGLPVNEAIQEGMAVIVSDGIGGGSCLVRESGCGYIFKAGDSLELANYLQMMIQDRELRERKRAASEEYSRRISPTQVSKYFQEVIKHVKSSHKGAKPIAPWLKSQEKCELEA
jgi:glycosyltransferase involved in cell wall biosynthesis